MSLLFSVDPGTIQSALVVRLAEALAAQLDDEVKRIGAEQS